MVDPPISRNTTSQVYIVVSTSKRPPKEWVPAGFLAIFGKVLCTWMDQSIWHSWWLWLPSGLKQPKQLKDRLSTGWRRLLKLNHELWAMVKVPHHNSQYRWWPWGTDCPWNPCLTPLEALKVGESCPYTLPRSRFAVRQHSKYKRISRVLHSLMQVQRADTGNSKAASMSRNRMLGLW